jgi:hypothetical protein
MGAYDSIGLPVKGQPISSGAYGQKVRDAIIDLDDRVATVENALLPRYYVKSNQTVRSSTATVANDSGSGVLLAGIPLEIGTYEIEFLGYFNLVTTGSQGIRTSWAFTGTWNGSSAVRNCLGPGDSATPPNNNATLMAAAAAPNNTALYYTGASASWSSIREITCGLVVSAAGLLSLQWAQAVSNANATNLNPGSYFRVTRYA